MEVEVHFNLYYIILSISPDIKKGKINAANKDLKAKYESSSRHCHMQKSNDLLWTVITNSFKHISSLIKLLILKVKIHREEYEISSQQHEKY